jgi:hypothetical protein
MVAGNAESFPGNQNLFSLEGMWDFGPKDWRIRSYLPPATVLFHHFPKNSGRIEQLSALPPS